MKTKTKTLRPVLILDFHRGIYFGYLKQTKHSERTVVLEKARHCYHYPVAEVGHRGVYGLATVGPADGAKVGPEVTMTIHDVSKIVDCTPRAVERWQKAKW